MKQNYVCTSNYNVILACFINLGKQNFTQNSYKKHNKIMNSSWPRTSQNFKLFYIKLAQRATCIQWLLPLSPPLPLALYLILVAGTAENAKIVALECQRFIGNEKDKTICKNCMKIKHKRSIFQTFLKNESCPVFCF